MTQYEIYEIRITSVGFCCLVSLFFLSLSFQFYDNFAPHNNSITFDTLFFLSLSLSNITMSEKSFGASCCDFFFIVFIYGEKKK